MTMKKPTSIIGWVYVICFLLCFVGAQAIASDAVPGNKTAQSIKSKKMKLEELVQKLEDANPWSVEKVSEALGAELSLVNSHPSNTLYIANRLEYGEGLIVDKASLRLNVERNKMIGLVLNFAKDTTCFEHDHIKKIYPTMNYVRFIPYGMQSTYIYKIYEVKRSWGDLSFEFDYKQPNCLTVVILRQWDS